MAGLCDTAPAAEAEAKARILKHVSTLSRGWPGDCLDDAQTVRLVNAGGTAPPLFWTFNSGGELPALAAQLPSAQPIVGMRSLNQIVPPDKRATTPALLDLATHYADTLLQRFGTGPCLVGGNCQAAEVAYHIAIRLLAAGAEVQAFVTLDAEWQLPLPVPVKLIFGRDSDRNPVRTLSDAQMKLRHDWWSAAFAGIELAETDGAHGQYFQPQNVPSLARQILSARRDAPLRGRAAAPGWTLRAETDGQISLTLPPGALVERMDRLRIVPVLDGGGRQPPATTGYSGLIRAAGLVDDCVQFRLPRPPAARLLPALCLQGQGPLSWPVSSLALEGQETLGGG